MRLLTGSMMNYIGMHGVKYRSCIDGGKRNGLTDVILWMMWYHLPMRSLLFLKKAGRFFLIERSIRSIMQPWTSLRNLKTNGTRKIKGICTA